MVLDADSVMNGTCLTTLVRLAEANPDAGIIQTMPAVINGKSLYGRLQQFAGAVYGPIFAAGDAVELRTRRGRAVLRARVTDTIRPDTVFAAFHWGGTGSVNALTDPALDRHSRMPAFKVCAVSLARPGGPDDTDLLTNRPPNPAS